MRKIIGDLTWVLANGYPQVSGQDGVEQLTVKYIAKSEGVNEILPDFDRDRVHPSDIKKLIQWYNLLVEGGFTRFAEQESQEAAAETAGEEA